MILINLLPVRQLKKRAKTRNEVLLFCAALVVVLAVVGSGVLFVKMSITQKRNEVARLEAKKKSYNKTLNEIKKIEAQKKQLFAKIEAIKQLKRESQTSVHVLDQIARATPPNSIWLEDFKLAGKGLQLRGVALDNTVIAEYMDRLELSPYVGGKPKLGSSARKMIARRNLKSFSLSLSVTFPSHEKENAAAGGKK